MEHSEIIELHQQTYNYERMNLDEALKDISFRAGMQWPEELQRLRLKENRPVLVSNQINKFVNRIVGDYLKMPLTIKVLPQDSLSDINTANVINGIIRNIDNNSQSDAVYAKAFDDAVCGGAGYIRVKNIVVDYESYGQELRIEAVANPLSVAFDPDATGYTKEDAQFAFVYNNISRRKFGEMFGDMAKASDVPDIQFTSYGGYETTWFDGDFVRIGEFWEKTFIKHEIAIFEDGSVIDLTELGMKAADIPKKLARTEKRDFPKITQYIYSGNDILEKNDWVGSYIPIVPMIGQEFNVNDTVIRAGLVRNLRDPQFMYNFMRSVQLEAVQLQSKAPFIMTPKQIEGFEAMYRNANSSNLAYLLYNPDPAQPNTPKRLEPPVSSQGLTQMVGQFNEDLREISGVYDAALGAKGNETSGIAIKSRQAESQTTNFMFVDHAKYTQQQVGRVLVDLIPKIYTGQKIQRILNDKDADEFVQLNTPFTDEDGKIRILNDLNTGKYDVVVSVGPSYESKRQEIAETVLKLLQLMPNNPDWTAAMAYKFIQNLDIPDAEGMAAIAKKFVNPQLLDENPVETNVAESPTAPPPEPPEGLMQNV
jgi:hypothetical protein